MCSATVRHRHQRTDNTKCTSNNRECRASCRSLLVDEPTRGIDVGAKAEIYALLNELTKQGLAILMVSSELSEILAMSDRILVMYQGRLKAELYSENATEKDIMRHLIDHSVIK